MPPGMAVGLALTHLNLIQVVVATGMHQEMK